MAVNQNGQLFVWGNRKAIGLPSSSSHDANIVSTPTKVRKKKDNENRDSDEYLFLGLPCSSIRFPYPMKLFAMVE